MYEDYAKIRDAKGYSDYTVAKGTGISAGTISDWKKGRYNLKADKLAKIAEFLEVSVDDLLGVPKMGQHPEYYINDEVVEIAQEIYDDPDLHMLFSALRGSSKKSLQAMREMVEGFKETNPDG